MLHKILTVRVSLALVFFGAFSVMLLIKLTSLLPAQYYFSFSKLVAGDRGPFLVDPPSVSGEKLCELLRRNRISSDDLQTVEIDCNQNAVAGQSAPTSGPRFSPQEIDAIYNSVLVNSGALQQRSQQLARQFTLTPMSDEQLEEVLNRAQTVDAAVKELTLQYSYQVGQGIEQPLRQNVEQLLARLPEPQYTGTTREQLSLPPLSENERARLRAAHTAFIAEVNARISRATPQPVRKSDLDGFVENAWGKYGLTSKITEHHSDPIKTVIDTALTNAVAAEGLQLRSSDELQQMVFSELSAAGLRDYAASALIRLAAVLLFGIAAGIAFGRHEFVSISVAAALAAFLLSWPLMLMWENLVDPRWNDQRPLFLVFYGVYILSFYFTARFGAVIGALIRRGVMRRSEPLLTTAGNSAAANAVTFRDFIINLGASVFINIAVYATNMVIPLTAAVT
jgi:hypothetical protein